MVGQVRSAVDAAVGAMAAGQVGLESLGLGHLDHVRGPQLLAGVRSGRVAAPLDLLAEETPEDASQGRRGAGGLGRVAAPRRRRATKTAPARGGRRPRSG